MTRVPGPRAIIGILTSVVLFVALAWYAAALRTALAECRESRASSSNELFQCQNRIGSLREELSNAADQVEVERRRIRRLEARIEAAGAIRRCALSGAMAES